MNLQELKSRYDGKCTKCGRDIKQGWSIFYDKDDKKVYCKPCGSTLENSASISKQRLLRLKAGYTGFCERCGRQIDGQEDVFYDPNENVVYCQDCGISIEEMASKESGEVLIELNKLSLSLKELIHQTSLINDMIAVINDMIAVLGQDVTSLDNRIETVEANILTITATLARVNQPKTKTEKEPESK